MDPQLRHIAHLYGEAEGAGPRPDDSDGWAEYQDLSQVKFHLDHARRSRPDARTIDGILAAAAAPGAMPRRLGRRDRPARPRRRALWVGLAAGTLAVVLAVGLGQGLRPLPPAAAPPPMAERAASELQAPALLPGSDLQTTPAPGPMAPAARKMATATPQPTPEALAAESLAWDASGDVLEIQRRLELLQAGLDANWETPAVPLDAAPGTRPAAGRTGLLQAGTQRPLSRQ